MKKPLVFGAMLALSPFLLLGLPFVLLHGCNREMPVSKQDVIGSYNFELDGPEAAPQLCMILYPDGTFSAQGLHRREHDIPASGKWELDGAPEASSISVGLFTSIFKDRHGTVTIKMPEAENGYDCVKHR